ncbi:unnamed protein product [Rodentolepis nana]|uniref:Secreted protein n=1 Tax=Rodentolepis nana TaxID=102285 RepID=A0A0R3TDS1_RODNA|nr:unnamed protein product [Rodentolepis nana]
MVQRLIFLVFTQAARVQLFVRERRLDTESGGSFPFPPVLNTESGLDIESGGSSPFPPLVNTESGGSSPFSPVENQLFWVALCFQLSLFAVLGGSLLPIEFIGDCEFEGITALVNCVSRQNSWHSAILMAYISPSKADLLCPAAA